MGRRGIEADRFVVKPRPLRVAILYFVITGLGGVLVSLALGLSTPWIALGVGTLLAPIAGWINSYASVVVDERGVLSGPARSGPGRVAFSLDELDLTRSGRSRFGSVLFKSRSGKVIVMNWMRFDSGQQERFMRHLGLGGA